MTLIAYKDGILCADTLRLADSMRCTAPVVKIARNRAGDLFAAAGSAAIALRWMEWFLSGDDESKAPPDRYDDEQVTDVVIFTPNGASKRWVEKCNVVEHAPKDRLGLGWPSYLHGLMDAGLPAFEAVSAGIRRYTEADYPLIVIGHHGEPTIWEAPWRQMPAEVFERQIGRPLSDYFYDPA